MLQSVLSRTHRTSRRCVNFRNMSAEMRPVEKTKVTPYLTLRTLEDRTKSDTLVIFFPWLYAPQQAIDKYCDVYHQRGYDVLSVSCQLKHFLLPSTSTVVAKQLLNYLGNEQMGRSKYVVHSASVGSYVYTVVMMEMVENLDKYNAVKNKINGQIYDSITVGGLKQMANGIAARSKHPITQHLIRGGANSYFFLTSPFTVKFYDKAIDLFKSAPCRGPALLYYCLNDSMSDPSAMKDLIEIWTNDYKMTVIAKCWEKSIHAGHLRTYPEEYLKVLDEYLHLIDISSDIPNSKL